ncbi:MAG: DinB family protein [Phycisphaerae bacterium]
MPDVRRILNDIAANEGAAAEVVRNLSDWQLNWQQLPGESWSVAQTLDHIALTNNMYVGAMLKAVVAAPRPTRLWSGKITPSFFGQKFIENLEPPVTRVKVKAPKEVIPASRKTAEEVLAALKHSHQGIRQVIDESTGMDLNEVKFVNPFAKLLRPRLGTGLRILMAHERRHLWQASNIRQAALSA